MMSGHSLDQSFYSQTGCPFDGNSANFRLNFGNWLTVWVERVAICTSKLLSHLRRFQIFSWISNILSYSFFLGNCYFYDQLVIGLSCCPIRSVIMLVINNMDSSFLPQGTKWTEQLAHAGCNLLDSNCQPKYQCSSGSLQSSHQKNIRFDCKMVVIL